MRGRHSEVEVGAALRVLVAFFGLVAVLVLAFWCCARVFHSASLAGGPLVSSMGSWPVVGVVQVFMGISLVCGFAGSLMALAVRAAYRNVRRSVFLARRCVARSRRVGDAWSVAIAVEKR